MPHHLFNLDMCDVTTYVTPTVGSPGDVGRLPFVTDKEHRNEESAAVLCHPPHSRLQQGSKDLDP